MNDVFFEITQWPDGQSLDVVLKDGSSISIAGVHGGGVGHTIKRFKSNAVYLNRAIVKLYDGENSLQESYVACRCPKCKEEIALKIYAAQPILKAEIADVL